MPQPAPQPEPATQLLIEPFLGGPPTVSITGYQHSSTVAGIPVVNVATRNHLAEADPVGFARVTEQIEQLIAATTEAGIERSRRPIVGPGSADLVHEFNPVSMNLLEFADGYWSTWRDLVPSAMALLPIQAPHTTHLPWPAMTQLPQNRDYLLHIYDSIGIRSRAAVMADLLTEHARSNGGGSWLSLACGAALSVLQAAVKLPEQVTVDLVDLDPLALEYAAGFAQALGLEPNVTCRQVDLLDVARLPGEVPIRGVGFDVVEMMGFFEYLPDQPRDIDGSMSIPSAGQFLQAALDLAAPGALVVFGNMLTTHPQKDFILKVVQWPYVRPRDLDELARLVSEVGVDPSQVTFYTPDDGVYAVVAIRLPR